jgi:NAD(P)-dependent dehydrogenase (short-subunit alcohol dehydrogenase family)
MTDLSKQVALVTGASRGVGRGVALGLANAGARVFATGRSIKQADFGAVVSTLTCDHTDDEVRTKPVVAAGVFDLSNSESPEFIGRAVAALAGDVSVSRWSGQVVTAAALGTEYGFTDVDGRQPRPLAWNAS